MVRLPNLTTCRKASAGKSVVQPLQQHASRRQVCLLSCTALTLLNLPWSQPTEPPPPEVGNCPTCIGLVDGTLGSCAGQLSCASTYDDRPPHFAAPWEFTGSPRAAQQDLISVLEQLGASIQQQQPGYVYATFTSQLTGVYDTEFAFGDNDNVVSVRSSARLAPPSWLQFQGSSEPLGFLDSVRQRLGWEEVPILRNRRRALFFVESPWDSFGPVPPPGTDYRDVDSTLQ